MGPIGWPELIVGVVIIALIVWLIRSRRYIPMSEASIMTRTKVLPE